MNRRLSVFLILLSAGLFGGRILAQTNPDAVNIPGTLQPGLGCPGEWQPDCEATFLEYDAATDVWSRAFEMKAGSYAYKVAINKSWGENYGGLADSNGANITLTVPADQTVTFYYDHKTHWIADNVRHLIVTAPGDYQDEIGCASDDDSGCLRSWLQDVDGDGIYLLTTSGIPAGDYTTRIAINGEIQVGDPLAFTVGADGDSVTFAYDSNLQAAVVTAGGSALSASNLRERRAHWVSRNTLAWDVEVNPDLQYKLLYSADASLQVSLFGVEGNYDTLPLNFGDEGVSQEVALKFPHLAQFAAFHLAPDDVAHVPDILKGQFAVAAYKGENIVDLAGLQIPGVLDDLYTYAGELGVNFDINGIPSITVWAPTARSVSLQLFADSDPRTQPEILPMIPNASAGTWRIIGTPDWKNKYYLFEVDVFAPTEQAYVINEVTDPYSVSLSVNSLRSQIVDLDDPILKPDLWDTLQKPPLEAPEDIVLYELHIRDFSAFDETVPESVRGTYLAFTIGDSDGVNHLRALADAGLTHLHLLPTFDIATINENRERWFLPDYAAMAEMPPDSEEQQAAIFTDRDRDGFNWGYDPYHYNVPEGSYSTTPDGSQRIMEYRRMVQAINQIGLRVVIDVVYNHTNASGQERRAVLDKIVPGYYHRLDERGNVANSTCCENTATEHNMMRRLMVDSVVMYATAYKIDGFRFDLMGHHMLADMQAVRAALDALTLEADGVDGKSIYVYGEGWDFGEVADNVRGINATQLNIGGTGIGVFNDRLRDAVRGGNPFGDQLLQGLSNGLALYPNGLDERNTDMELLLLHTDQVRASLAGNLRDYAFLSYAGEMVTGADVDYNGEPAGYTFDPQENIVYAAAHDNETLYDIIAYKAPRDTTPDDRVRMNVLALSYVMYSQGVLFFHAGDDMLRSKSMDRNSYNSGDWFNRLDFSYNSNNFGVGLPPAADNSAQYEVIQPLLADPNLKMDAEHIQRSVYIFRDMLRVRKSSPLFRLQTAQDVMDRLTFYNVGEDQLPGVIVMLLDDTVGDDLDPTNAMIVVVFNAANASITVGDERFVGQAFALHPMLADGTDDVVKTAAFDADKGAFTVPGLTTAVFVLGQ